MFAHILNCFTDTFKAVADKLRLWPQLPATSIKLSPVPCTLLSVLHWYVHLRQHQTNWPQLPATSMLLWLHRTANNHNWYLSSFLHNHNLRPGNFTLESAKVRDKTAQTILLWLDSIANNPALQLYLHSFPPPHVIALCNISSLFIVLTPQ